MDEKLKSEAAFNQVRETFIKSGMQTADRLRELRSLGKNFPIAMSKSGGLALIQTKGTKDHPRGILRFGSPLSPLVAVVDEATIDRWNRANPGHEIEMWLIQPALERECSRIFLLLHEIHKGRDREIAS